LAFLHTIAVTIGISL